MPNILDDEISSAAYVGLAKPNWIQSVSAQAAKWVKAGLANVPKLFDQLVSGITSTAKNLAKSASNLIGFFGQWFKDDPVAATAGVAVGVGIGVILVEGTIALGSLVGGIGGLGGLVRLALTSGALGGVGAAINHVLGNPIGAVIQWLVQGVIYLYNFDWQISDADLDKQVEAALTPIYASAGIVLGHGVAAVVCGAVPGAGLVAMNLSTVHKIWETLKENTRNEIVSSIAGLVNTLANYANAKIFAEIFKTARKWIKMAEQDPFIKVGLQAINPNLPALIEHWGDKGNKPFRISTFIEEKIESIKDKNLKAFAQSGYQAFFNSCLDKLICLSFVV